MKMPPCAVGISPLRLGLFCAAGGSTISRDRAKDVEMDSWYLPAAPAVLAVVIIGYSLYLAYA